MRTVAPVTSRSGSQTARYSIFFFGRPRLGRNVLARAPPSLRSKEVLADIRESVLALCGTSLRSSRVVYQEIVDGEKIQAAVEKRANRILGAAHDGFFVHVETGVDHARQA